ncbi:FAD-binding domain-containing protein [Ascobolus immersus RN42]|uniref:FAD-binding domain-containing protein n=1 Tax=Ascobolus immersus RN42 TaxID=1160509 RepID=A0A3N4HZQ1_ASCIM|nr:FAD-binding domain-containing protein [Ascobolus immersus RN42]
MGIAKLTGTPFAVKSGGHNMNPGWSSVEKGILIKMDRFKSLEYDAAAGAVHLGPGLLWKEVVPQLAPYNVTVVGGRVPGVGVGGLILGGGLSYLSNRYGMAADNVLNYELVAANGNIINANATYNSDLFWAMKGGSTNYGIVTKYTLRAIPLGPVYGAIISYGPDKTDEVMAAYAEYQKSGVNDVDSNVLIQITSDPGYATLVNLIYLKPVWKPEVFAPFYKVQARFDTSQIMSFAQYILMQEQEFGGLLRWQLRGTSYKASLEMDRKVVEISQREFVKPMSTVGASILIFQPVAPSVVKAGNQRNNGGNPLGIESVGQTWFSTCAGWNEPKNDQFIYAASKKTTDLIEKESKKKGLYLKYIFMNDAFMDQNVFESYGKKNFDRMKAIAKKYDPEGVFQRLWSGGFKLFQTWCSCQN